jgi:hypothetical protein
MNVFISVCYEFRDIDEKRKSFESNVTDVNKEVIIERFKFSLIVTILKRSKFFLESFYILSKHQSAVKCSISPLKKGFKRYFD